MTSKTTKNARGNRAIIKKRYSSVRCNFDDWILLAMIKALLQQKGVPARECSNTALIHKALLHTYKKEIKELRD